MVHNSLLILPKTTTDRCSSVFKNSAFLDLLVHSVSLGYCYFPLASGAGTCSIQIMPNGGCNSESYCSQLGVPIFSREDPNDAVPRIKQV